MVYAYSVGVGYQRGSITYLILQAFRILHCSRGEKKVCMGNYRGTGKNIEVKMCILLPKNMLFPLKISFI